MDDLQNQLKASGQPYIQAVAPNLLSAGDRLAIQGFNFGTQNGNVSIGASSSASGQAAGIVSWSDSQVVVTVPAVPASAKSVPVMLQTQSGAAVPYPAQVTIVSKTPSATTT